MRRKGPGYLARMYGSGRRSFLEAAKGYRIRTPEPASKMCAYTIRRGGDGLDFAEIERRTLAYIDMDFAAAAGRTLAAVSADPRNHFGKHALRRFDK